MNLPSTIPAVVSKRNEFQPADELVEEALPFMPEQYRQPAFPEMADRIYGDSDSQSVLPLCGGGIAGY